MMDFYSFHFQMLSAAFYDAISTRVEDARKLIRKRRKLVKDEESDAEKWMNNFLANGAAALVLHPFIRLWSQYVGSSFQLQTESERKGSLPRFAQRLSLSFKSPKVLIFHLYGGLSPLALGIPLVSSAQLYLQKEFHESYGLGNNTEISWKALGIATFASLVSELFIHPVRSYYAALNFTQLPNHSSDYKLKWNYSGLIRGYPYFGAPTAICATAALLLPHDDPKLSLFALSSTALVCSLLQVRGFASVMESTFFRGQNPDSGQVQQNPPASKAKLRPVVYISYALVWWIYISIVHSVNRSKPSQKLRRIFHS